MQEFSGQPLAGNIYDYRKDKSNLLDKLKRLRDYAQQLELHDSAAHAASTIARIEDNFFRVAVVGEFNRGKSTLINALLGTDILPTDVLACSATLNRITYGSPASVSIVYKAENGEPPEVDKIAVEQLKDYVTKTSTEALKRAARIDEAIVHFPTEYCRDKADIIDTPGLNDEGTMSSVTYSVLPNVDAAIMIVLANAAFAETEGEFLNSQILNSDIGRVLFVINRIDEIRRPEDRERIRQDVIARIRRKVVDRANYLFGTWESFCAEKEVQPDTSPAELPAELREKWAKQKDEHQSFIQRIGAPQVFAVSALDALEGKLNHDEAMLAGSGFPEFEKALEHFLVHDRGVVALQVLTECASNVGSQILHNVRIKEGALKMRGQEFESSYVQASAELRELRERQDGELRKVDDAANRALARARQILEGLGETLRDAAARAVDSTPVKPEEMKKASQERLKEKFVVNIRAAISLATQKATGDIQLAIEREVTQEISRLQDFAAEVRAVLGQIEKRFNPHLIDDRAKLENYDLAMGVFISTVAGFGLGGIWTGYKEGGLKGAAAGGAAGVGTMLGVATIAVLSLPMTFPVFLGTFIVGSIASAFVGKRAAQRVGLDARVEQFKEDFKQQVAGEINKHVDKMGVSFDRTLVEQVGTIFEALKQNVRQEFGSPIEQTRKTLDDLRESQTRTETELELELARLSEIKADALNIQKLAVEKANTLRQITAV